MPCVSPDLKEVAMNFLFKESYDFDDLLRIVGILRSPEGCQWDMKQDHHSVRSDLIEETYEVLDAIDRNDTDALCEELGDLLLQVVFHTQMEKEIGGFEMSNVTDGICKKLIERHPHVFGSVKVSGEEEILTNWDEIKKESKGQKTQTDAMKSVPKCFPSLLRATKLFGKADKVNYDAKSLQEAVAQLQTLTRELGEVELNEKDSDFRFYICGRLLFSVVKIAHILGVDSEYALSLRCDDFIDEFEQTERLAELRGINLKDSDAAVVEALRDEAKA